MSESLKSQIALDALDMVVKSRRPSAGLIHHSDRGVQYACGDHHTAGREIFCFIEVFYNRQRMDSYLGDMSPAEFEAAAA